MTEAGPGVAAAIERVAAVSRIARVAHEANRAWCAAHGDHTQPPWDEAPEWQRQSARNGVQFHLDNPASDASASHDAWMDEKLADGWTWALEKNADRREHPCLVPFHHLPEPQQAKDRLFRAVVHALADKGAA